VEIETAARLRLLQMPNVTNLVGNRIWKWEPEEALEGTGHGAIILRRSGQWTKPGPNSQEYPLLVIEAASDYSRGPDGQAVANDAETRVYAILREVDRALHQKDREVRRWPTDREDGLLVLGCFRGSEPTEPVDKWGVKVARVTYDVQCVHSG